MLNITEGFPMKYFFFFYVLFISSQFIYTEDLVVAIAENEEVRFDMNEVILAGENLEIGDIVWKDGRLEEAWDIFTKLELELTNPTLLGNVFLRKGILAQELGRNEQAGKHYLSFMYSIYRKELEGLSKEERESLERELTRIGMSQAEYLKTRIFSLHEKNA